MTKFRKKDIPNLRYAMIHSQFGMSDGVSIVMKQIQMVMTDNMQIPRENIFYLVGKSESPAINITTHPLLWDANSLNRDVLTHYKTGLTMEKRHKFEEAIVQAQDIITQFIEKHKIDVLIAHNSSLPLNFISSIALSRYYKEALQKKKKTPKYIIWWHDSHQERDFYLKPAKDIENYILEGVPGPYVEYFIFINSLQIEQADSFFLSLDKNHPGFYDRVQANHDVAYNTTETFISSFADLQKADDADVEKFLADYDVIGFLGTQNIKLKDTVFCLQHTRIVERKRIDFAIRYGFEVLKKLREQGKAQALYFFISGYDHDRLRDRLTALVQKLSVEYQIETFYLRFAWDLKHQTTLVFEEFPRIFAKLGGFTTYFSEIEGFGNNLLEVLASGLIPVVYTYPVFKKDIAKYNFQVVALDDFVIERHSVEKLVEILFHTKKRCEWIEHNLKVLKKHFPHKIIKRKLTRAIIRKRSYK